MTRLCCSFRFLLAGVVVICCCAAQARRYPYQNPQLTPKERAKDLCRRLTLEEKVGLMMNYSHPVERLDVPVFQWWNEALHGVGRNGHATVFPITMGMAATFDTVLVERIFTAVSDEARVKYNQARRLGTQREMYHHLSFWTPNINIFRDP
ncbi:MAG: glycoside hydrolase family 3 protein, partial [Bacteroidaceae bacterium]|nr:glycoside hydrolase family 3 protein [Bacteroidaceae bacterium]